MGLSSLSPTTWNTLGLGVASSWVVLSSLATFSPHRTAALFGITVLSDSQTADHESTLGFSGLLGSRDLAIGLAMYFLAKKGRNDELGTLILSTLCICAADIGLVLRRKSYGEYVLLLPFPSFRSLLLRQEKRPNIVLIISRLSVLAAGTAVYAVIGLGLRGLFN